MFLTKLRELRTSRNKIHLKEQKGLISPLFTPSKFYSIRIPSVLINRDSSIKYSIRRYDSRIIFRWNCPARRTSPRSTAPLFTVPINGDPECERTAENARRTFESETKRADNPACFTRAPCARRLHATSPVHVRRSDRASHQRGVCLERGIQADTHAERFLGRKIARAHCSHSLPRALLPPPLPPLARSLALRLMHVRGSPMQTPTTTAVGPAPGFRVGFSPWKRRDCRGPAWLSEAWPVVRFFFPPSSFRLSCSSLPLSRDSPPFPSHRALLHETRMIHGCSFRLRPSSML